jgi:hypothetical protein
VIRRPHSRKKNQCVMNRQPSTSISGKHHPENARREGKSTPRSVTVCELNISGGVNTTNHLGSGECNARAGVGFKHAYDILFQQVDRHRQQNDILH